MLVCKAWRSLLTSPEFATHYRKLHRAPPLLGFFENEENLRVWFEPSSPTSPFLPMHPDHRDLVVLDSRHGLVLLRYPVLDSDARAEELIVWDPVGRRQWEFPPPEFADDIAYDNAVVLCADDHLGFTVVYVGTDGGPGTPYASVFSSQTRAWSAVATIPDKYLEILRCGPKALLGNVLYFCGCDNLVLRYDLFSRQLSIIEGPIRSCDYYVLVKTEEGVLGWATMEEESELCLWSMETAPNGAVAWTQRTVVKLDNPCGLLGFLDGPGVFYLNTASCIFTVELKSGRVNKISISRFSLGSYLKPTLFPYMSFYTPGDFIFRPL
jgi:hypothetical protein